MRMNQHRCDKTNCVPTWHPADEDILQLSHHKSFSLSSILVDESRREKNDPISKIIFQKTENRSNSVRLFV